MPVRATWNSWGIFRNCCLEFRFARAFPTLQNESSSCVNHDDRISESSSKEYPVRRGAEHGVVADFVDGGSAATGFAGASVIRKLLTVTNTAVVNTQNKCDEAGRFWPLEIPLMQLLFRESPLPAGLWNWHHRIGKPLFRIHQLQSIHQELLKCRLFKVGDMAQ